MNKQYIKGVQKWEKAYLSFMVIARWALQFNDEVGDNVHHCERRQSLFFIKRIEK